MSAAHHPHEPGSATPVPAAPAPGSPASAAPEPKSPATGAPVPGGGLPIREWEASLAGLDSVDEISVDERTDRAQELLTRLEDALEAL